MTLGKRSLGAVRERRESLSSWATRTTRRARSERQLRPSGHHWIGGPRVCAWVRQVHNPQHRLQIAATLHRFVRDHGDHVRAAADSDWDTVTIVPSKTTSSRPHALERAIKLGRTLAAQYRPLLQPWKLDEIERARGSDRGYRATGHIDGLNVLLIDDTFTSGATFQSAASALALDGAHVVAGIVIGRVIHPEFTAETGALWEQQRGLPFDFDVCCLE
jgi:phosphoribosylpyrophosphate synthetase